MTDIAQALQRVKQRIENAASEANRQPQDIKLLAVSKTKPASDVQQAYDAGQRAFGENYLQDALPKIAALPLPDIEWHFIGRVQSNKTRDIAKHFAWVHGIDKLKHAQRLSQQRDPQQAPLNCCIQVNLSDETSKGGVTPAELPDLAAAITVLPHLKLRGLMTMPDPNSDKQTLLQVFTQLRELRNSMREKNIPMDTLSMGMSGDLEHAVASGSTLVRIGTDIFGARPKANPALIS